MLARVIYKALPRNTCQKNSIYMFYYLTAVSTVSFIDFSLIMSKFKRLYQATSRSIWPERGVVHHPRILVLSFHTIFRGILATNMFFDNNVKKCAHRVHRKMFAMAEVMFFDYFLGGGCFFTLISSHKMILKWLEFQHRCRLRTINIFHMWSSCTFVNLYSNYNCIQHLPKTLRRCTSIHRIIMNIYPSQIHQCRR